MSSGKTVRVRIAVAVDPDGFWSANGWAGSNEKVHMERACDTVGEGEARYWLEADLPIPEQQTFEATVTEESR